MTMKPKYAVILCVLVLLVSACAQKVNDPADVQAIKDMVVRFDKAVNSGDAEALAADYDAAGGMRLHPNQPALVGREAIRSSFQKLFDQSTFESHNVAEDVRVSGALAVARGTYEGTFNLKAGGSSVQDKGKWATASQRQADGSWKCLWAIYNSDLLVADSLPVGVEEQALMQIERDWAAAGAKNDWAALDKILAAEYVNNSDGTIRPKKQILAEMKSGASKTTSATTSEMRALVLGETGIVQGLWAEKGTRNGKDTSATYRFTDIFVKRDGRWQVATSYSPKVQ
jgi:uncharacterized protein (TIGR02246 family)